MVGARIALMVGARGGRRRVPRSGCRSASPRRSPAAGSTTLISARHGHPHRLPAAAARDAVRGRDRGIARHRDRGDRARPCRRSSPGSPGSSPSGSWRSSTSRPRARPGPAGRASSGSTSCRTSGRRSASTWGCCSASPCSRRRACRTSASAHRRPTHPGVACSRRHRARCVPHRWARSPRASSLVVLVIGVNLLVDGLRDVADPTPGRELDEPARGRRRSASPHPTVSLECDRSRSRVAPGERLGLIGESGSGKSLTSFAIIGLLPAGLTATGSVVLDGTQVVGAPESRLVPLRGRVCAFVFQEPLTALDPLMRLGRQLAEPIARHQGLRGAALQARRPRCARGGAPAGTRTHRGVSFLRDLRRPAPARRHRHGARMPSAPADRGRADHGARRDRPVRGAVAAGSPGRRPGHGPALRQPRPGGRLTHDRPRVGDAGRRGGGARAASASSSRRRDTPTPRRSRRAPTGSRPTSRPRSARGATDDRDPRARSM